MRVGQRDRERERYVYTMRQSMPCGTFQILLCPTRMKSHEASEKYVDEFVSSHRFFYAITVFHIMKTHVKTHVKTQRFDALIKPENGTD
jgi:hypothetical protein